MLIGYGIVTNGQYRDVLLALNNCGCQKIFTEDSDTDGNPSKGFYEALDFLEPNDILVVTSIGQLGKSIDSIVKNLALLSNKKTNLQILENNSIYPLKQSNGSLLQIIINFHIQATHLKSQARHQTCSQTGKKPGRKTLMDENTKKKINTLIDKNYKVQDICDTIGINESTFYRHFSKKNGYKSRVAIK